MKVPPWTGGLAWAEEIRRQARVMGCKASTPLRTRFTATARQLTPWRVRSSVQCNRASIEAILPILEHCRRDCGRRLLEQWRPWSGEELGELLTAARNRAKLYELGREQPHCKGPRFDPRLMPIDAIERLIQRHPDLTTVDRLRDERIRRAAAQP